ncbi:hypothetical protein Sjap_019325 [Stephania japonica]|uniref:Uncharacterized protein n=1 Tax=Stephania japonica TaxID=461633 RepID=A0AAP0EZU8_9MAGN
MVHFLEYFEDSLHVVELSMLPYMVVLLSNVIRRYPYHSRSLSAAQKALMHIKLTNMETVIDSLGEVLEPISWLVVTFSMLEPGVREFLGECTRAVKLDEISAKPHVEKFQSSLLSALTLHSENHVDDGG